jgi:hypothetical protein
MQAASGSISGSVADSKHAPQRSTSIPSMGGEVIGDKNSVFAAFYIATSRIVSRQIAIPICGAGRYRPKGSEFIPTGRNRCQTDISDRAACETDFRANACVAPQNTTKN